MIIGEIATRIIDEDEDDVTLSVKALVKNDSDDEDVWITLQGLDQDGFVVSEISLEGRISLGEQRDLTESTFVGRKLHSQIVQWREK